MKSALLYWVFATLFFGAAGWIFLGPKLQKSYELKQSYNVAEGLITNVFPANHSTCKYSFSVENKNYVHVGHSCGNSAIGQKIKIYYAPLDPETSTNENPKSQFTNDLIPLILSVILYPLFAAFITYRRQQNRWQTGLDSRR